MLLQSLPLHAIVEATAEAGRVKQSVLLLLVAADIVEPEADTVEQRVLLLLIAADVVAPHKQLADHHILPLPVSEVERLHKQHIAVQHDLLLLKAPFSLPPRLVVEACSAPPSPLGAGIATAPQ